MAIGRPISLTSNVASKIIRVLATEGQTVFTVSGGYRINQIGVFRNGVRLSNNSDFTAQDGSTVTLVNAASLDDEVLFQVQDDFRVADAIVSAASSQTIDGNLHVNGNFNFAGSSSGFVTSITAGNNIIVSESTGNVTITGLANTQNSVLETLVVSGFSTFAGASFSGDVSIGGTLTYEDVTNIDSVGLVTARSGVIVNGSGIGLSVTEGGVRVTGIVTATSFSGNISGGTVAGTTGSFSGDVDIADKIVHTGDTNTALRFPAADTISAETSGSERLRVTSSGGLHLNNGELIERVKITSGKLSDNTSINLDDGMAHFFTTQETTTSTPNITSSAGINTSMAVGDVMSVVIITTAAAGGYSAQLTIDGAAVTERWNGGSAPSAGGAGGNDFYSYSIIKTGNNQYTVLANVSNFA